MLISCVLLIRKASIAFASALDQAILLSAWRPHRATLLTER
jgi:hypothetical protein